MHVITFLLLAKSFRGLGLVIISPEVDAYTDEDRFDDDFLNVEFFPQEVGNIAK